MALSKTTTLDAVNQMLRAIGGSPVSSLDTPVNLDVAAAKKQLEETSRAVQSLGWNFNTEKEYPLARNASNEIIISADMLSVDLSDGSNPGIEVTERDGKLYDKTNHRFTFEDDVKVDVTWYFEFDKLPEPARAYIAAEAAVAFQADRLGVDSVDQGLRERAARSRAILEEHDTSSGDYNMLTGSYAVASILYREGDAPWTIS